MDNVRIVLNTMNEELFPNCKQTPLEQLTGMQNYPLLQLQRQDEPQEEDKDVSTEVNIDKNIQMKIPAPSESYSSPVGPGSAHEDNMAEPSGTDGGGAGHLKPPYLRSLARAAISFRDKYPQ